MVQLLFRVQSLSVGKYYRYSVVDSSRYSRSQCGRREILDLCVITQRMR